MQNEILRYEELSINAFPAIFTELYDGWILRYSNGYTFRGNCVNPLYKSSLNIEEKLKYCENKYLKKGLPCVFKITDNVEKKLDTFLQEMNYDIQKRADIMNMNIEKKSYTGFEGVKIEYSVEEEWLERFVVLNGTNEEPMKTTAKMIIKNIENDVFCISILENKEMAACGLGVLEDGKIGLYDIRVLQKYRRRGYGTKICEKIIQEGIKKGAHTAYLQVASANDTAIDMYKKIGFKKVYTYWYRVKNNL